MSAFYVGQRVRVVANFDPDWDAAPIGLTGHVVAPLNWHSLELGGEIFSYEIDSGDGPWLCRPGEIEPICDPGREVVSWASCLWRPEGLAA
jgi:hypothetical protein